ncbi:MAG: tRNA lysidine(34) synthetase TilS, partial [Candidatus Cloacimonetes bacterium]|nr:tRNA lysidine(34) synthetase TilS [Candidatus Cloacimonadota bacterium]
MNKKNIVEKIENYGLLHSFFKKNVRILVGLSGGPDSICLSLLLKELQEKYSIFLMAAHVNYHLRGDDSNADEDFVKVFCYKNSIPLYILSTEILKEENLQQKARDIRFEYFYKLKKHYKIDYIALGHQMDDQIETVLLKFLRGAGFRGLGGIAPERASIIHPLLTLKKTEIHEYLSLKNQSFRVDSTNETSLYTRNKIRNELLPLLCDQYNPNLPEKLFEYGNFFYLTDCYFRDTSKKYFKKALIDKNDSEVIFDVRELRQCFPIISYYIYKEAWQQLTSEETDFYHIHFQEIMNLVETENGYKEISLPEKMLVIKDYELLVFRNLNKYLTPEREDSKEISIGRNIFSFNDSRFTMQKLRRSPETGFGNGRDTAVFDLDKIIFPIKLRYRQNGDKFIPFGMESFKKVKDYLIDEKVSMLARDNIVLFTDAEKIFWVSNYRIDQRVAVSEETKNFLQV